MGMPPCSTVASRVMYAWCIGFSVHFLQPTLFKVIKSFVGQLSTSFKHVCCIALDDNLTPKDMQWVFGV